MNFGEFTLYYNQSFNTRFIIFYRIYNILLGDVSNEFEKAMKICTRFIRTPFTFIWLFLMIFAYESLAHLYNDVDDWLAIFISNIRNIA